MGEYYRLAHASQGQNAPFVPGETFVNYGGRVYDERELQAGVEAILDFWLTDGPRAEAFSDDLEAYLGLKHILTVNSGSSGNLVAMTTLRSAQLDRPLQAGDEVITPAATFPTTVAPIVQNGLIPVFVDCKVGTYNIDVDLLEAGLSDRTRAVFVPHILGNPVEMDAVMAFAAAHDLYVIEDTCDALGSVYDGKPCGTFGHLATFSFYPAHHITTGEGAPSARTTRGSITSPTRFATGAATAGATIAAIAMASVGVVLIGRSRGWASPMTTATISPRSATTSR